MEGGEELGEFGLFFGGGGGLEDEFAGGEVEVEMKAEAVSVESRKDVTETV